MRIDRLELREIRLPLTERFEISSGFREDRRILLVTVYCDGIAGWGECVAAEDPSYSYETVDTAWLMLTDLVAPAVVGARGSTPEEVMEAVSWIRGHRMATASVEMALWDRSARSKGKSLAEALGGSRASVPVGVSVGLQKTDDELFEKVEGYLHQGYRKIKIKIKPGRDVEMLAALRRRFGPIPLMADANSAYTLSDSARLRELDDLDLLMIEQPLSHDDYLDHAILQRELRTSVCLDESIRSVGDARLALELGSCRIVNIKPGRVGGHQSSRRIHDLCRAAGVDVWCGGMLESGIGRAHNLALATLPGFAIPGDISESRRYWARDVVSPEFVMNEGMMAVPEGPGIGVEPDLDRIRELTVRFEAFDM